MAPVSTGAEKFEFRVVSEDEIDSIEPGWDWASGACDTQEEAWREAEQLLRWACQLHEIGLSISHNGYHKHSAYVLRHADMPGFSRQEQARLAAIVLGHTGKLPKMKDLIDNEDDWRLVMCLRLAAVLHRSRSTDAAPPFTLRADKRGYALTAPYDWLERNPLTEYDLRQEIEEWQRLGTDLRLVVIAS